MSTAHRPTWSPAQGKEVRGNSRQFSARDVASHTKLKFRQPGQGMAAEIARRDLRLELERAEKRARKEEVVDETGKTEEDEQAAKRRKLIADAAALDKDDSDEETSAAPATGNGAAAGDEDDEEESDSDDDEDETAELLRELEKIKRERAEEKARQDAERAATDKDDLEAQIAVGNPLLNLQNALNRGNASPAPSSASGFTVKRRWDDDVIFKNQARGATEKPEGTFVNDLLRTEFHRRFIKKFVA